MDLVKIVSEMIDLREDLKETARQVEWKSRRLDRVIDELMENLKHRGLVVSRRAAEKPVPGGEVG